MEFKELPAVVMLILIIGIVVGVGVIVLNEFGNTTKDSTVILNESLTISSGTGTTTYDDIVSIQYLVNASDGDVFVIKNNDSSQIQITGADRGTINSSVNGDFNISYTYLADSPGTTALFGTRDAVDDFVTWLPVIIIILSAAIILGLVMKSFKQ